VRDADIRGIDVAIHVEIRLVAVHALANIVGHPTHRENVAGVVESEGVDGVETLTSNHFRVNRHEARIVSLKWMFLERSGHPLDDIAGAREKSHKGEASGPQ
jgi:hypothetical protein